MDTDLELEMARLRQDTDLDAEADGLVEHLVNCPNFKGAIAAFVEAEAAKISSGVLMDDEIKKCVWDAVEEVINYAGD